MKRLLEIACFSAEAAAIAASAGAQRIELCDNYSVGGVTPDPEIIKQVRRNITVPLHVIIRPRGGDFVYTPNEITLMQKSISFCKNEGVDGIVLGALTRDNKVDVKVCEALIKECGGMSVTFHRAIDSCSDLDQGMEELIKMGVSGVLTSGGKATAAEGMEALKNLQAKFGNKITVMPGGGIRSANISALIDATGCGEYHSAALATNSGLPDRNEIRELLDKLKEHE